MTRVKKSDEANFRAELKAFLRSQFDTVSMETRLGDGLPDEFSIHKISGQVSLVELKQSNPSGPYDSFKFDVRPEQSIFLCKRVQEQSHVNALILGRINRREFIALPAVPDVEWTGWARRTISLREKPKFPVLRLKSYEQIAELLADNLYERYVENRHETTVSSLL